MRGFQGQSCSYFVLLNDPRIEIEMCLDVCVCVGCFVGRFVKVLNYKMSFPRYLTRPGVFFSSLVCNQGKLGEIEFKKRNVDVIY